MRAVVTLLCGLFAFGAVGLVEAEEGFVDLFAGDDLSGWVEEQHNFFKSQHPDVRTWSVKDGVVACDGSRGNCGFLRYRKELGDFTLRLEYRTSKGCNSGVGIRARVPYTTINPNTLPSSVGYEVQILDDAGKPPGKGSSGGFYGVLAPRANASKPAGQWNALEITCTGPKIHVTLNGQVIHDVDRTETAAIRDRVDRGYLSLQNHGHRIEFRNLRLKELN